ncbi:MAG: ATP-binding protein [Bacteroidales bacterium]|nr:ATP-binding protein [Bacteroidales bacterium]
MERTIIQSLKRWKEDPNRKPLILNGARQVGKTWALRNFAQQEYSKEAYIICRKNDLVRQLFTQDFDTNRILRGLRAISGVDITPNDTLIILDEVQDVPEIIESLKYFYETAPDYHIAVAGSLLGIAMHTGVSYPVGKVNTLHLYPMDFEEFLLAKGETEAAKILKQRDYVLTNMLHEKFVDLLRQYYYVGGMPEAVKYYVENGALQKVRSIQEEILKGYDMDFSKHAPQELVARIRLVWQSIPSQLFKENKKFIYGALRKGARANEYELAIQWLIDAGLLYQIRNCNKLALPLDIYADTSAIKLYMLDIGLMGAMVHTDPAQVLIQNNIFSEYKGGMTEQYVLQQLKASGTSPIYYHKSGNSRLEIDFIIQQKANLLPIEVKAEGNVRANSLSALIADTPSMHAVRFSMLPYKEQDRMTNIPLYAV